MPIYTYPASTSSQIIGTGNYLYKHTIIHNNSTAEMKVGLGLTGAAALTNLNFSFRLPASGTYETDYNGNIHAIWDAAVGSGLVTKL